MCAFLCGKREFINLTQSDRISANKIGSHIPGQPLLAFMDDDDDDNDIMDMSEVFSCASVEL